MRGLMTARCGLGERGVCALLALSLLVPACAQHPLGPAPDPDSIYLPYDSPDGLVENFARCWRRMDIAEYGDRVLYDGNLPAVDGNRYRPFVFYNEPGFRGEPTLDFATELAKVGRIFSGEPGRAPGVASIELKLTRIGAWIELSEPGVLAGDAHPAGCWQGRFAARLVLHLKPDPETPGALRELRANTEQVLLLIPVPDEAGGAPTAYRLWKWWELAGLD